MKGNMSKNRHVWRSGLQNVELRKRICRHWHESLSILRWSHRQWLFYWGIHWKQLHMVRWTCARCFYVSKGLGRMQCVLAFSHWWWASKWLSLSVRLFQPKQKICALPWKDEVERAWRVCYGLLVLPTHMDVLERIFRCLESFLWLDWNCLCLSQYLWASLCCPNWLECEAKKCFSLSLNQQCCFEYSSHSSNGEELYFESSRLQVPSSWRQEMSCTQEGRHVWRSWHFNSIPFSQTWTRRRLDLLVLWKEDF